MNTPPHPPAVAPKRMPTWLIVVISLAGVLVLVVPVLAVVAIFGVRKYLATAKSAEALISVGELSRDVAAAYEKNHALCPSASAPVPASLALVRGTKYMSTPADWAKDGPNAGFACLGFSLAQPQYYQYSYTVPAGHPDEFVIEAHGDLNGDGHESTFAVRGSIRGGTVQIPAEIEKTSPEE